MSLLISSVYTYDADVSAYILAVEAADGQTLEPATRSAINKFVVGCKADGTWSAIKASCILAGARTLAGALVPLVGTAPTNFNFVSGDYNRKTGLVGNASNKYLDTNRLNTADPLSNLHISTFVTSNNTSGDGGNYGILGTQHSLGGVVSHQRFGTSNFFRCRSDQSGEGGNNPAFGNYLMGASRSSPSAFAFRTAKSNFIASIQALTYSQSVNYCIFRGSAESGRNWYSNARLAFYSIGESLDLARLDSRVTDLINAFAVTIP